MHRPINVKSPNNISEWQMGFNSAFKGLTLALNVGGWSAPHTGLFTSENDPVPIIQEAGWAPGLTWTSPENLARTGTGSPDRPVRSDLLYHL